MAPRQGLCHPANPMKAYCHHHSLRPGGSVTGSTLMTSLRPGSHYSPAQLLTLEQSADLLLEQTRKHQELQAKLAAQKLSEDLRFSTGSYVVEGGLLGAYREAHDDGAQLSPEEV